MLLGQALIEIALDDTKIPNQLRGVQTKVTQEVTRIQNSLNQISGSKNVNVNLKVHGIREVDRVRSLIDRLNGKTVEMRLNVAGHSVNDIRAISSAMSSLKSKTVTVTIKLGKGSLDIAGINALAGAMNALNGPLATMQSRSVTTSTTNPMSTVAGGIEDAKGKANEFDAILGRVKRTLVAFAVISSIIAVGKVFNELIESGIEFNKQIESSRIGIASLITAETNVSTTFSDRTEGIIKFNASLALSDKIIKQLQTDNLETIATFDQLVKAYQSALAPGLSKGLSTDQIRQYTVAMVQAAGAMNVPLDMMGEELRSLLKGTITPRNTIIATNLGITNEDIRRYEGDVTGLFDFIMDKLKAFSTAGKMLQDSFEGVYSNFKDIFKMAVGQASIPFFNYLKDLMKDLINKIATIDEKARTITLNPDFVSALEKVFGAIKGVTAAFAGIGEAIWSVIQGISKAIDIANNLWNTSTKIVNRMKPYGGATIYASIGGAGKEEGYDPSGMGGSAYVRNEKEEVHLLIEEYQRLISQYSKVASAQGFNLRNAAEAQSLVDIIAGINKKLEEHGVYLDRLDGWHRAAAGGFNRISTSVKDAVVSMEAFEKKLKELFNFDWSSFGNNLKMTLEDLDQEIKYLEAGGDPKFLGPVKDYSRRKQKIEQAAYTGRYMGMPGELGADLQGPRTPFWQDLYEKEKENELVKQKELKLIQMKEDYKKSQKVPFDEEDLVGKVNSFEKQIKRLYQELADMDHKYVSERTKLFEDAYSQDYESFKNTMRKEEETYQNVLDNMQNSIDSMWKQIDDKVQRKLPVDPSAYSAVKDAEDQLKELKANKYDWLMQNSNRQFELFKIGTEKRQADDLVNLSKLNLEYGKLKGSMQEQLNLELKVMEAERARFEVLMKLKEENQKDINNRIEENKQTIENLKSSLQGGDISEGKRKELEYLLQSNEKEALALGLLKQKNEAAMQYLNMQMKISDEQQRQQNILANGSFGQGFALGAERYSPPTSAQLGLDAWKELEKGINNAADALTEFTMTGKMDFNNFANSFIRDIIRMMYQALIVTPILSALKAAITGSGAGSILGSLFGSSINPASAASQVPVSSIGGMMANGGSVSSGIPYVVGEKGPELFVPDSGGSIVPNSRFYSQWSNGGGISMPISVQVTAPPRSDDPEKDRKHSKQFGKDLAKAIEAQFDLKIKKELRSGGMFKQKKVVE